MNRKNIHAYTAPGHDFPAVLSVNIEGPGRISIMVRSQGNGGRNIATIEISPEQAEALACDLMDGISGAT